MRKPLALLLAALRWPLRSLRRIRRPRRLTLTREGKYYVLITIAVGLAAINTGNNLLYLVLGWLLSTIIASGVLSNQSLRGLRVTRRPPGNIFANKPFLMELEVENGKARLASYTLEIEDVCAGHTVDKQCFFLKIPPRRTLMTSYRHTISRRGLYHFDGVQVSTRFPFGLFRKTRFIALEDEILVYPQVRPVPLPPASAQALGETQSQRAARRGEFFGIREYRTGDDQRAIHWRSTARSGRLLVREFEEEAQKRVALVIDNALPPLAAPRDQQALEEAIRLCASLAQVYQQRGYAVALVARGASVGYGSGNRHLYRILRELAVLNTVDDSAEFTATALLRAESILILPKGVSAQNRPARVSHRMEAS